MSNIKIQTLKGFRDFLPQEARKRQYVVDALKEVFELYGFEPLETPALEYEEILLGKYGEEGDKLMYRFEDLGKRKVALRYDQTVPLARVVAQYQNELPMPFKRYQIQPVWRAENTQKGRFREFMQCDADIVGVDSPLSDAEVIALSAKAVERLGFKNYKILINDRKNLLYFKTDFNIDPEKIILVIRILDKLKKIGKDGVIKELVQLGFTENESSSIINNTEGAEPTERLNEVFSALEELGIDKTKYEFSPTLARGLDYYTGVIFEIEIEGYTAGSVCGGGRYDNLIGIFSGKQVPAVGFAFGFDRLIDAMNQLNLFPDKINQAVTKVLVTIFPARNASGSVAGGSKELKEKSMDICSRLRSDNINCELYLDENAQLEKQLKYANQKGIPHVVIIGPNEAEKNEVILRNMQTREQKTVSEEELIKEFK